MAKALIQMSEYHRLKGKVKELNELQKKIRKMGQILVDEQEYGEVKYNEEDDEVKAELLVDQNILKELVIDAATYLKDRKTGKPIPDDFWDPAELDCTLTITNKGEK